MASTQVLYLMAVVGWFLLANLSGLRKFVHSFFYKVAIITLSRLIFFFTPMLFQLHTMGQFLFLRGVLFINHGPIFYISARSPGD